METNSTVHHRWVWAGIAVRDEEGNMMVLQMDNPQGQVESSQEFHTASRNGTRFYVPGPVLLRVHLRGTAVKWDGSLRPDPREIESIYREVEDHGQSM